MPDFEAVFGDFLDCRDYDRAENALFSIVRASFKAGWIAAGGDPPLPQKMVELRRPARVIPLENLPDTIQTDIEIPGVNE
jgi:hypothetical protein